MDKKSILEVSFVQVSQDIGTNILACLSGLFEDEYHLKSFFLHVSGGSGYEISIGGLPLADMTEILPILPQQMFEPLI